jgi:hypothetical protein
MVRRGGIKEGRAEFLARYLNPLPVSSKDIHLGICVLLDS